MLMVATIINVIWIIKPCWVLTWDENGVKYNLRTDDKEIRDLINKAVKNK